MARADSRTDHQWEEEYERENANAICDHQNCDQLRGSVEAKEFSPENDSWHPLPKGLRVLGSKYALVITSIIETDLSIDANQYTVAVGASLGKPLIQYLRARVDKACVNKVEKPKCLTANSMILNVKYVAKLFKPYAVFLR